MSSGQELHSVDDTKSTAGHIRRSIGYVVLAVIQYSVHHETTFCSRPQSCSAVIVNALPGSRSQYRKSRHNETTPSILPADGLSPRAQPAQPLARVTPAIPHRQKLIPTIKSVAVQRTFQDYHSSETLDTLMRYSQRITSRVDTQTGNQTAKKGRVCAAHASPHTCVRCVCL